MKRKLLVCLSVILLGMAGLAQAAVIDFTGGTAYMNDSTTSTTNANNVYYNVDYYVESGFVLNFIEVDTASNIVGSDFTSIIGNYYGGGGNNDVIHGHWNTGAYGDLLEIQIYKTDNSTFDLNYFELTSNTDFGGGVPSVPI